MIGLSDLPDFKGLQACAGMDPDVFFPDAAGQEQFRVVEVANLCRTCPVRDACLEYALSTNVVGIWSGTTTAERNEIRRRAGISVNPQVARRERDVQTIDHLTRLGFEPWQITETTPVNEQTVWRRLRETRETA